MEANENQGNKKGHNNELLARQLLPLLLCNYLHFGADLSLPSFAGSHANFTRIAWCFRCRRLRNDTLTRCLLLTQLLAKDA